MREYRHFCGVAKALDVVGQRWTLLLVRDLLLGGRRYTDLLEGLPGITTNLLASRLQHLEGEGLLERRVLPPPTRATVYELTARGRELEPVVLALGRFGARYLEAPPEEGEVTDLRWLLVSLKRRYRGGVSGARLTLISGDVPYAIGLEDAAIEVRDGAHEEPTLTVRADGPRPLQMLLIGRVPAKALLDAGEIELEGSRRELARVLRSFG